MYCWYVHIYISIYQEKKENHCFIILVKRPAKENIEKYFHAEYTLHGPKLFAFLFGEKLSKSIEEHKTFWFDTLASAFSGKIHFYFSD